MAANAMASLVQRRRADAGGRGEEGEAAARPPLTQASSTSRARGIRGLLRYSPTARVARPRRAGTRVIRPHPSPGCREGRYNAPGGRAA